jgi:hypothetical protein
LHRLSKSFFRFNKFICSKFLRVFLEEIRSQYSDEISYADLFIRGMGKDHDLRSESFRKLDSIMASNRYSYSHQSKKLYKAYPSPPIPTTPTQVSGL